MKVQSPLKILQNTIVSALKITESIPIDLCPISEVYDFTNELYFDTVKAELKSFKIIINLVENGAFKECFIILRAAFELFLYFWLMLMGKKFRMQKLYTILPDNDHDAKTSRDETYAMWREKWKTKTPPYDTMIEIQSAGEDKIHVTYEFMGLYNAGDKQKTGPVVPYYVFVLSDHYDQSLRFNAELPSIKAGDMFPDITEERIKEQKNLYHNYIYFEAILKNLLLNNLITKTQQDYIIVHYNFLSKYVHPTISAITQFTDDAKYFKKDDQYPDEIVKEQVYLYIARILKMLISIIVQRFEKECDFVGSAKFKSLVLQLDIVSNHFWFIDNEPQIFDKSVSKIKKDAAKHATKKDPGDIVLYYQDPLDRLYKMKTSSGLI